MPTATKEKTKRTSKTKHQRKKRKRTWMTAATSDRHILYEKSVQDPASEMEFIDDVWKERRGRLARTIREDFCGTAAAACAWVKRRPTNRAVAIDIDPEVLAWARARLARRLSESERRRLTLRQANVMTVRAEPVDSVLAMNFSYYLFKTRPLMRRYFKRVHKALVDDGIFLLDAYGGSEAFEEMEEERDCDGFTYVWDQRMYNPISGDAINHIHFRFPDGSEMRDAFTYEWRLWTLPELREILEEAGFDRVTVYWEGSDEKTGEGNGEFTPETKGDACAGWIAYIVAEKLPAGSSNSHPRRNSRSRRSRGKRT